MDKHILDRHQQKTIVFPNIKENTFEWIIRWICDHSESKYSCQCGFKGNWNELKDHDRNVVFETSLDGDFKISEILLRDWDVFKIEESAIRDILSAADFFDMKYLHKIALKCLTFIIIKRITQDSLTADNRMKKTFSIENLECKECNINLKKS